jgi:hypothetical protein
MRRDGLQSNGGGIYMKTTGRTVSTGWIDIPTAAGTTAVLPAGIVSLFGGSAAPTGWLICDGSAISRTTYSILFAAVGTTYGAGDGSTTFNLPDLRGRVPVGLASGGATNVATLGNNDGHAATTRNVSHHHTIQSGTGGSGLSAPSSGSYCNPTYIYPVTSGDSNNLDAPAYLVINYIIKT